MAVTITPLGLAGANKIIRDSDSNGTAENNSADGAVTVYAITVDNSAAAAVSYPKFFNSAAPTVGTTDPEMVLMVASGARRTFIFKGGLSGIFTTALSWATVTTGGTGGTTNPSAAVVINIVVG